MLMIGLVFVGMKNFLKAVMEEEGAGMSLYEVLTLMFPTFKL